MLNFLSQLKKYELGKINFDFAEDVLSFQKHSSFATDRGHDRCILCRSEDRASLFLSYIR